MRFSPLDGSDDFMWRGGLRFYSARNARIASAVLAIQQFRPSVSLSVTRRYCVKTTARSKVQFALSDSKMCLVWAYGRGQTDRHTDARDHNTFRVIYDSRKM